MGMVRCRASRARQGETPRMKLWRSLTAWLPLTHRSPARRRTEKATPPEVGGRSLRLRLLFWIIIWLMPAAVVSVVQGIDRVQRDVSDVRERLVQTAHNSAADEESVLTSGEQVLRALANQPEVQAAGPDCGKALVSAIKGLNYFTNIARIDAKGQVLCSAVPPPPEQEDVSKLPWWASTAQHSGFFITPQIYSVASHREVLGGVLPLRTARGEFDGALAFALDVGWLDVLLHSRSLPAGAVVAVFDPLGTIVGSNNPELAEKIFI